MNKITIIRYLNDETTESETTDLFHWIEQSPSNRRYFNAVKNLWVSQNLHQPTDVATDFDDLEKRINRSVHPHSTFPSSIQNLTRIAALLAIPLALMLLWMVLKPQKELPLLTQIDNPWINIYAPLCTRAHVQLPDGTNVWLNSGSKLSYPRLFEGDARTVYLEGEAYFDVVTNDYYPFIVNTVHKMDVEVRGTSFNISAYKNDSWAILTLVSGTLNFVDKSTGKKTRLNPLQSASYQQMDQASLIVIQSDVNTDLYTSWKDGILVFDRVPMLDLANRLERWYGVTIHIEDSDMLHYTYTGRFKEETIGHVLELIKQSSNIAYKMEEKQVFLYKKQ